VGRILSGEPEALGIQGAEPCRAGQGWDWSGVRFRVFSPPSRAAGEGSEGAGLPKEGNDKSCVLRVEAGGRSVLLPGDIGKGVEKGLVQRLGTALKSDVLIAGHHGSATSTGAAFLDAVAPGLVLYAAGYANRFGFPAREVRERVASRATPSLNTGIGGAIELRLGADGTIRGPWAWRERARRLWTHRPAEDTTDP
jgi:competence protein ComEC